MEFDFNTLAAMGITGLLGLLGKGIWDKIKRGGELAKETGEVLTALGVALEDKKITSDEAAKIFKEAKDVGAVFTALMKKSA